MKKKRFKIRYLLYAVIAGLIIYTLINQQIIIFSKQGQISSYNKQYNQLQSENNSLKDEINYSKTNDYKERMARERIGLILPGETVYVFDNN